MNISVKQLEAYEVASIGVAFEDTVWKNTTSLMEDYLAEQVRGERTLLVAYADSVFAGYVTIKWQSDYRPFAERGIPLTRE